MKMTIHDAIKAGKYFQATIVGTDGAILHSHTCIAASHRDCLQAAMKWQTPFRPDHLPETTDRVVVHRVSKSAATGLDLADPVVMTSYVARCCLRMLETTKEKDHEGQE